MFQWPDDFDEPINHMLGRSFEALDPIRVQCRTYIVWNSTDETFNFLGDDVERVKEATLRIRGVLYQIVARKRDPEVLFKVRPLPKAREETQQVQLMQVISMQMQMQDRRQCRGKYRVW